MLMPGLIPHCTDLSGLDAFTERCLLPSSSTKNQCEPCYTTEAVPRQGSPVADPLSGL